MADFYFYDAYMQDREAEALQPTMVEKPHCSNIWKHLQACETEKPATLQQYFEALKKHEMEKLQCSNILEAIQFLYQPIFFWNEM